MYGRMFKKIKHNDELGETQWTLLDLKLIIERSDRMTELN